MKKAFQTLKERAISLARHYKKSLGISWRASPPLFLARIAYELFSVSVPIVSLYLSRTVINILSSASYATQKVEFYQTIAVIVALNLLNALFSRANTFIGAMHADKVAKQIDLEIIQQINRLDISYFDNPEFYDQIQNAVRDSQSLQSLTWLTLSMIKSVVQFVSNLLILVTLNVYLPIAMIILCLPGIFIDKYVAKRKYEWQLQRARTDRKLGYIKRILQAPAFAKDTRLFGVQDYFKKKHLDMWEVWFKEKKKLDKQRFIFTFSSSILPHVATTAVLIMVGNGIFSGALTLGDYSLYGGVANQLLASITAVTGVINQSYESEMRLTKYAQFLKLEPFVKNTGTKKIDEVQHIEFRNVSFTYPNTNRVILKNISFELKKNQSIALVGLNGAGKSTIVKLLLRLYDPDGGEILVNGINVKEYDMQSYYKCIGVVFQDFCRYNLKIREAIALTDIEHVDEDDRIIKACKDADLDLSIVNPETGIDTYLGKVFDVNGIEFSGGNWQKVAIAQAYFKKSSLMVFDEPNAALDPEAERRLFEKMTSLSKDKCVVYVTHRLSSATTAGQIIVINNGVCIEKGTHQELMDKQGMYCDLFNKQAQNYRQ